jgi:hypothetical protein
MKSLLAFALLSFLAIGCCQAAVPVIVSCSESAGLGDVVYVQGSNFGGSPVVQYSLNDSTWLPIVNLGSSTGAVTFSLPASETRLPDLFTVRVSNDNGSTWSQPVAVNKPIARFFNTDQISPQSAFKVYGANLYLGHQPTVRFVDVATGASQYGRITISGSSNYMLNATGPSLIQAGHTYQVYVSNGFSGNSPIAVESLAAETLAGRAAGSDYWQIGLPWAADFTGFSNIYNVKSDPRLGGLFAAGDGSTNDLWPINHAIQIAARAGGGIVYLPPATYALLFSNGCGIQLASNVFVVGLQGGQSAINYGYPTGGSPGGYAVCFASQSGLVDVTFNNVDGNQQWQWSAISQGQSEILLKRVTWNLGTSQWLNFLDDSRVAIQSSVITQGLDNKFNNLGPLNMSGCQHCEVSQSTIKYITCGILFDSAKDMLFDSNHVIRDISASPDPSTVTHHIAANFVSNFAVTNNMFEAVGPGQATNNDGEVVNTEAGGAVRVDEFRGTVTSATSMSLTDAGQTFNQSPNSIPNLRPLLATVAIVSGIGLGQTRTVMSVSPDGRTIGIDQPWDVQPEPGAHYATFDWSARNWILANNTLTNNFKGFEIFDASAANILIQGNSLVDSDGIMVSPSEHETTLAPQATALFNVIKNLRIIGNTIKDLAGKKPAYVGLLPREDLQAAPFGTHIIGAEIKSNSVTGYIPNVVVERPDWDDYKVKTEGFLSAYYWQSYSGYNQANVPPPLLATVYQGNTAINSTAAFYLNSGATHTVMADSHMQKVGSPLADVPLAGASQGAEALYPGSQLQMMQIGPVSANVSDIVGPTVTSTGMRAIAMGHEGAPRYTVSKDGDLLTLFGQSLGTDSEVVTRASLTNQGTATGLLMMRSSASPVSPFVSVGLSAGNLEIVTRTVNAGSIQTTLIPFQGSTAMLRLRKNGATFALGYSADGLSWSTQSFHVGFSARTYLAGVGLVSEGTANGPEAYFEGLTFTPITNALVTTGGNRASQDRLIRIATRSIRGALVGLWHVVRRTIARVI